MVLEIDVLTSNQSFLQTMEGESSRAIAQDYINYRLIVNGHVWNNGRDGNVTPSPVENAMRNLGDEFEQRFRDRFDDMINQLHVTEQNAYDTFHAIVAETFADGVNWGRIVALFGFAGRFAIQCYTNNMQQLVDNIVDWVSSYMDNHLSNWIHNHNGWNGFLEFYEGGAESRRNHDWPSFGTICGYAGTALGALALVGFLTQKS